jgi:hypothetical protein
VARRQHGGGGRGRLGPVGNAVRGTGGAEAEWSGRMGTTTQGGNGAASIGARGQNKQIYKVAGRAARAEVSGGSRSSRLNCIIIV